MILPGPSRRFADVAVAVVRSATAIECDPSPRNVIEERDVMCFFLGARLEVTGSKLE